MTTPRTNVGTVEDLHASASKMTGLTDFGDPGYREGLQVLLESYAGEA
ncbi:MAG: sulfotransferase, partial [Mycobacteriaceae bacterium]